MPPDGRHSVIINYQQPMQASITLGLGGKDCILESLASNELDDLLGLDLDPLAGRRIAARTGRTLDELHLADGGKGDALLFLLGALDGDVNELLVHGDCLLLGDAGGLSESCHDATLGGRNEFFLSHFSCFLIRCQG